MGNRKALIGICAAVLFSTLVASAGAEVVDRYVYPAQYPEASFSGGDAVGAEGFGYPIHVAVDEASGDVYVASPSFVYHLNSAGESIPFSAIAPSTVLEKPMYYEAGMAVDNSGTGTQGRLYLKTSGEGLAAYLPSGAPVGAPFPLSPPSGACGVDVAPDGGIWVATSFDGALRFGPGGAASNESIPTSPSCHLAIDADENFYSGSSAGQPPGQPVKKNSRTGALLDAEWAAEGKGSGVLAIDRSTGEVMASFPGENGGDHVNVLDSDGDFVDAFGYPERSRGYPGLGGYSEGLAVNGKTHTAYVINRATGMVDTFVRTGPITVPTVHTEKPSTTVTSAVLEGTIDPDTANGGGPVTNCAFEWGTSSLYDQVVPCDQAMPAGSATQVTATITGLEEGREYHFRVIANSANKVQAETEDRVFRASEPVVTSNEFTSEVFSDSAKLNATVAPRGSTTTYHFEFGTEPCSTTACAAQPQSVIEEKLGTFATREATQVISGLQPDSTYYWRIVTENDNGPVEGPDHSFTTFPVDEVTEDSCGNALVRKQTGAAHLAECRAYELVSAADTGGYDVSSSLVPGQQPLPGYPDAIDPPRALYTVHYGAIPGVGDPPNFGGDPYVATRGSDGWTTEYVGLPVSGTPDPDVFSSALLGADARLDTFAFGGPDVCVPCFADGSSGIPVRRDAGTLTQGMRGSLPVSAPEAAGEVRAPLSPDGGHLVFGSTEKLEPAGNDGSLSIYDRNLDNGGTQVVSTLPDGTTMSGEVAELGISNDGSRIVVGRFVGKDDAGNKLYDLYMHRDGDPHSVAIADTPHGASYGGMTADGGTVYFTTVDPVSGDSDTGADLYRARIGSGPAEVARVSAGSGSTGDTNACTPAAGWNDVNGASDCSVLTVSGTGGIAEQSGLAAFLSPELLDGGSHGVAGEPNLYTVAADGSPEFVATLATTDPLVLHAREDTAPRYTADFQITPSGRFVVFASRRPITNYPTNGHQEIYRYDTVGGELICVSCASTGARAESDASMPAAGGALSDEGTVFFTTRDPLNLRDLNDKTDIYESTPQGARLVSTGIDEFDSALLSASRDGKDVFFFTHDVLYSGDENGNLVKIYDARQGGGFYVPQTLPPCRASDECHGPSSESPPPPDIGTYKGVGGQLPPVMATKPKRCKRGQVRRHRRCVRKAAVKQRTKRKRGARR
jgi:hypothetical protein